MKSFISWVETGFDPSSFPRCRANPWLTRARALSIALEKEATASGPNCARANSISSSLARTTSSASRSIRARSKVDWTLCCSCVPTTVFRVLRCERAMAVTRIIGRRIKNKRKRKIEPSGKAELSLVLVDERVAALVALVFVVVTPLDWAVFKLEE